MTGGMQVIGLTELVGDLTRAATTVEKRAHDTTRESTEALGRAAADFAPKLTGALARSIEVTEVADGHEAGPTVEYGGFVEHGTSDTAPQPYMQPAADRQEPEFVKALEDVAGDL